MIIFSLVSLLLFIGLGIIPSTLLSYHFYMCEILSN